MNIYHSLKPSWLFLIFLTTSLPCCDGAQQEPPSPQATQYTKTQESSESDSDDIDASIEEGHKVVKRSSVVPVKVEESANKEDTSLRPKSIELAVMGTNTADKIQATPTTDQQEVPTYEHEVVPDKVYEFLAKLGLQPEQFPAAILTMLEKDLTRTCSQRIRNEFLMGPFVEKSAVWCCISTGSLSPASSKTIQQEEQSLLSQQSCCKRRIWPKNNWLPSYNPRITKGIAFADNLDVSTKTAFGVLWSPIFHLFMVNDIYNYFAYPADRGSATLLDILLGEVDTSVLTGFTKKMWFWYGIFGLGSAYVAGTSLKTAFGTKTSDGNEKYVNDLIDQLQEYQSTCWNNTCGALLPFGCGKIKKNLTHARRLLLWDANLSSEKRKRLLKGVINVAKNGRLLARDNALYVLTEVAYGIALDNFPDLVAHGMDVPTLASILHAKARAHLALKKLSVIHQKALNGRSFGCRSCYSKVGSARTYLAIEEALWKLGYGKDCRCSKKQLLVAMFLALNTKRLYDFCMFWKGVYNGSVDLYESQQAEYACEDQGFYYNYYPEYADYRCAVCGDFSVPFKDIFNRTNCWSAFLSSGAIWEVDEIRRLMDRIDFEGMNITDTDFSNLGLNDALFHIILQARLEQAFDDVASLDFSNNNISNISLLVHHLPSMNVSSLDLSSNQITDITALVHMLPMTPITSLDLSNNQLPDIIPLVQILPNTNLTALALLGNPIGELIPFVQAMLFYNLDQVDVEITQAATSQILDDMVAQYDNALLDLEGKQITDDDFILITQAIPMATWQNVSLSSNYISDITALASALPSSSLSSLDLYRNQISDITALASALPSSSLSYLDLRGNDISDITALASALPSSSLSSLYLASNDISDISPFVHALCMYHVEFIYGVYGTTTPFATQLAIQYGRSTLSVPASTNHSFDMTLLSEVLPNSRWTDVYLSENNITNITPLAQALPASKVTSLDLSDNSITDITPLFQTLPTTTLMSLHLQGNAISDISSLAVGLPDSNLVALYLSGNQISDLTPLAQALSNARLSILDLRGNQISDLSPLAQALPSSNLSFLYLSDNQINDIALLSNTLPYTNLSYLDLSDNAINDLDPLSNAIVLKEEKDDHSWFGAILDLFSDTQDASAKYTNNCPALNALYLSNNSIETVDAIDFCRALPATNIDDFSLAGNEAIDTGVINPDTCRFSGAPQDSLTTTLAVTGVMMARWLGRLF